MTTEIMEQKGAMVKAEPTAMQLLGELAKTNDPQVAVAVAQEIVKLQQAEMERQQAAERFQWEREERQGKIDFDQALSAVQKQIGRIAPDKPNAGVKGNAWYLTYAKLDSIVRPLYTEAGFSISFGEEDCPTHGKIRVVAHVSRNGITRKFIKDVTPPLLGPKGEPVMTHTHGDMSANSYARRYLVYDIFNIAVGIDKDDSDGNPPEERMHEADLQTWKDALSQAPDDKSYTSLFFEAHESAKARLDHLEIDLHALKCGSLAAAKVSFGKMYAKWRDANDADALKQITAGWEARKAAKQ
jgi:hypothetical protein